MLGQKEDEDKPLYGRHFQPAGFFGGDFWEVLDLLAVSPYRQRKTELQQQKGRCRTAARRVSGSLPRGELRSSF